MTRDWARRVRLDRSLDDECRALQHRSCGHIALGGGLRTEYVTTCTCRCHSDCPAMGAPLTEMLERCTCESTGSARQREAERASITYRQRARTKPVPAETREVRSFISPRILVPLTFLVAVLVAGIVTAVMTDGLTSYIGIGVAVLLGFYLVWSSAMAAFVLFIGAILKAVVKKVDEDNTTEDP